MNEFLTMVVVGVITGVISGLIVHLITRSSWIKDYFIDILRSLVEVSLGTLHSLVERVAEVSWRLSNALEKVSWAMMRLVLKDLLQDGVFTVTHIDRITELRARIETLRSQPINQVDFKQLSSYDGQLKALLERGMLDANSAPVESLYPYTPHEAKQIARRSSKIYEATLLKIYSRDHRKEFGDQMACAFEEQCRETLTRYGPLGFLRVWGITIIFDISVGIRERFSKSDDSPQKEIQR